MFQHSVSSLSVYLFSPPQLAVPLFQHISAQEGWSKFIGWRVRHCGQLVQCTGEQLITQYYCHWSHQESMYDGPTRLCLFSVLCVINCCLCTHSIFLFLPSASTIALIASFSHASTLFLSVATSISISLMSFSPYLFSLTMCIHSLFPSLSAPYCVACPPGGHAWQVVGWQRECARSCRTSCSTMPRGELVLYQDHKCWWGRIVTCCYYTIRYKIVSECCCCREEYPQSAVYFHPVSSLRTRPYIWNPASLLLHYLRASFTPRKRQHCPPALFAFCSTLFVSLCVLSFNFWV